MLGAIAKFIFGYDIFISYSRKDAQDYAEALAKQLETLDFTCFFDKEELPAGKQLPSGLKRAIRKSKTLLLIGTERSLSRPYIDMEVRTFLGKSADIVPINVSGHLEAAPWKELQEIVWIDENESAIENSTPSPNVLHGITTRFRFTRRNNFIRAGLVILSLIFVVLGIWALFQRYEAVKQAKIAQRQRDVAIEQTKIAEQEARIANSRRLAAQADYNSNSHFDLSLLLSLQSIQTDNNFETRNSLLSLLQKYPQIHTILNYPGIKANSNVAFRADGQKLAFGIGDEVIIWDVRDRYIERKLGGNSKTKITTVAFSQKGLYIAAGSTKGTFLWNLKEGNFKEKIWQTGDNVVNTLKFSPDGKMLAIGGISGISAFILNDWPPKTITVNDQKRNVNCMAFSPNGKLLVSGHEEGHLIFWRITESSLKLIGKPLWHEEILSIQQIRKIGKIPRRPIADRVLSCDFHPKGKLLASGSGDGSIILWEIKTEENSWVVKATEKVRLGRNDPRVESLAFSPNGDVLASGNSEASIIFWDVKDHKKLDEPLKGQIRGSIKSVQFSPDGKLFASRSENKIILLDITNKSSIRRLIGEHKNVSGIDFVPNSKFLISVSKEVEPPWESDFLQKKSGFILAWDISRSQKNGVDRINGILGSLLSVAFNPTEPLFATGDNGGISMWNFEKGRIYETNNRQLISEVKSLSFSPDGKYLAVGSAEGAILINLKQKLSHKLISNPNTFINNITFSYDGKLLAMVSQEKSGFSRIKLWDIDNERLLLELPDKPSLGLKVVTFNTAGNLLAAGGSDGIFLWDLTSKRSPNEKRLHEGKTVLSLAFCHRGNFNLIACGSDDGTIILFDLDSLMPVSSPLKGHGSEVNDIVYSPDLGLLASSGSHKIFLWDLNFEERACQIANRNFSDKEWLKFIGTDFVDQQPCGKFLANKP